jgi:hypothetical protein
MGYRIPTNFAKVGVEGSNPFARSRFPHFRVAQKEHEEAIGADTVPTGMIMD